MPASRAIVTIPARPVLNALVQAALASTRASNGWIVAREGDRLRVVAAGGTRSEELLGVEVPVDAGTAGFVMASGQPLALVLPSTGETRFEAGVMDTLGHRPESVVCVPCADDDVLGALELVDREGGEPFSFDDVETATLLAGIAGVALGQAGYDRTVPAPMELAGGLERLAAVDPARYGEIAGIVNSLVRD